MKMFVYSLPELTMPELGRALGVTYVCLAASREEAKTQISKKIGAFSQNRLKEVADATFFDSKPVSEFTDRRLRAHNSGKNVRIRRSLHTSNKLLAGKIASRLKNEYDHEAKMCASARETARC